MKPRWPQIGGIVLAVGAWLGASFAWAQDLPPHPPSAPFSSGYATEVIGGPAIS